MYLLTMLYTHKVISDANASYTHVPHNYKAGIEDKLFKLPFKTDKTTKITLYFLRSTYVAYKMLF